MLAKLCLVQDLAVGVLLAIVRENCCLNTIVVAAVVPMLAFRFTMFHVLQNEVLVL